MYFKILSIAYGALMILKGPVIYLLGRRWPRFDLGAVYPEKQPFWVWVASVAGLMLIGVTWAMHTRTHVEYSVIVALVVTLSLVKLSQALFNYRQFRQFAIRATKERPTHLLLLNVAIGVLGTALVLLGIFVY